MKLKSFNDEGNKVTTKAKGKEISSKSKWKLLARFVIIGRGHKIDVKNIMSYCWGPLPLGIAAHAGCLVKTNKARLLRYLESAPNHRQRSRHQEGVSGLWMGWPCCNK